MSIVQRIKNCLKYVLPPPTRTFLRETNEIKQELSILRKYTEEAVWGEIFNNATVDCNWLENRSFSPGRWALGYPALYALFRILNGMKPQRILELGLGQSTQMITQYATADTVKEHCVVEHDPDWIAFFQREYPLSAKTRIVQLNLKYAPFLEAENVRFFDGFKESFSTKKFDFICVDAPMGGDMTQYSRVDILSILPSALSDSFAIMIDDVERPGEQQTIRLIVESLEKAGIEYATGYYHGCKSTAVICSKDHSFLTSL